MALVGYARVSSVDQSVDIQIEQLKSAGCDKIFHEQRSGATAHRPQLQDCLTYVREGDVLVVTRLDRLARSIVDLRTMVDHLEAKGVAFRCIHQNIDTSDAAGRLMLSILGAFAEFELDIRKERQAEGIAKAKAEGKYRQKKKVTLEEILKLKAEGLGPAAIARRCKVGRTTVYRTAPGVWGLPIIDGDRA